MKPEEFDYYGAEEPKRAGIFKEFRKIRNLELSLRRSPAGNGCVHIINVALKFPQEERSAELVRQAN